MQGSTVTFNKAQAASLISWWEEMGVDTLIDEAPIPWLDRSGAHQRAIEPAPISIAAKPQQNALPETLEALTHWLQTSEAFAEGGPPSRRLAASGNPAAELMVIVDLPTPQDIDAGYLISGEVGDMFDRMLQAIGQSRDSVYVAALFPGPIPAQRIAADRLADCGRIALHHTSLIPAKRLWLLGDAVSRSMLGMELMKARGVSHQINQHSKTIEAVVSFSPRFLFQNPRRKADAWADMQLLIKGMAA
jgi:uracil-DNA glycosylase